MSGSAAVERSRSSDACADATVPYSEKTNASMSDDFPALTRIDELKQRQALWTARLQATAL